MNLVKATKKDLTSIMAIIGDAQEYLKDQNIDQWQNDYPNNDIIINDILNKESYLVKSNSDNVIATAMFSTRLEPTYKVIDGKWMSSNSDRYGVIHRMAIAKKNRRSGVSKFIFKTFETFLKKNNIKSMRIDTHVDNTGMQNLLLKLNYNYCGIIYLENGDLRLAYEKLI
ncbi:MAG: GNAT family N-acetyltransferase [Flavobacteriaceae bacterium]|jgi:hypothetical protein